MGFPQYPFLRYSTQALVHIQVIFFLMAKHTELLYSIFVRMTRLIR